MVLRHAVSLLTPAVPRAAQPRAQRLQRKPRGRSLVMAAGTPAVLQLPGARSRPGAVSSIADGILAHYPRRDRPVSAKSSERPRTRVPYKSKTYGSMLFASVRWNSTVPAYRFTPWFTPHDAPSPAAGRPSWAAPGCVLTPRPPSRRERGSSQPTAWIANLERRTPVGSHGSAG